MEDFRGSPKLSGASDAPLPQFDTALKLDGCLLTSPPKGDRWPSTPFEDPGLATAEVVIFVQLMMRNLF